MTELEKLKFNLKEKEDKLYSLRQNIFVLNPEIGNLVTQIYELKKEIEIKEGKENNAEWRNVIWNIWWKRKTQE